LHTMVVLAKSDDRRLTNQQIAETLQASSHHLAKVMQRLAKVPLVDSIRGPQGGFRLAFPAEEITLLEIYETIEGPLDEGGCLLENPICSGAPCILGAAVVKLHRQFKDYLENTTLAELAGTVKL